MFQSVSAGCSTCCQLVIEEECRFPTQLAVQQAAGLHREGVVVCHQQAADPEIGLCGVSQVGGLVGHAVIHMHFIALETANQSQRTKPQNS